MASDRPPGKVLPFARPRRFPADLDRLRAMLDDENAEFEDSDVDDGVACAEAAIAQNVPGGHETLADLLNIRAHRTLHAGDADAALAAWGALVATYPTFLPAYVMRATLLGKRGEHEAAMAELDRYVERSPTDAKGYLHRAQLYQANGDSDRALANFRRAAQLDRTSAEAQLGLGQALAAKGDARGAARAYAKAAEDVLGDAESYSMRGFMYFVSGQEELALADYEAAVALDPSDPENIAWRGICRVRQGNTDGAIADFTRLIAMRPAEARGYWRRGEALVRAGKPAEALRDLDRALALGGDDRGGAQFARGTALEALGDVDGALASYDVAIERDPANVACRLRRFRIYAAREEWARCQIDADAMLERTPDSPPLLLTHARLSKRNGRRDDALAAYDRLIALEPENAEAFHERAAVHVGRGDSLAARADIARAFELAPNDPEVRASHGRNLLQMVTTDEDRALGFHLIATSAELDAENPEAWARAAVRLCEAGHSAKAIPFLTRAIELDPDDAADYLEQRASCIASTAPYESVDPEGRRACFEAALADIERAMALCDDDELELELTRKRASLREDAGDLEGALADLDLVIEMAPEVIDGYVHRARVRKHTGDMPGALEDAAQVKVMEDETIAELSAFHDLSNMKRFNLDEE